MNNTKTVQLLRLLDHKELKKVSNFINSRYFNTENNVILLYQYLLNHLSTKTDKHEAHKYIYGSSAFNQGRLNYLSTKLYQLLKQFITVERISIADSALDDSVLKMLRKKNQKHLYQLEESIIATKFKKEKKLRSIDYQKNYLFEYERLNFYAEDSRTETKYIENLHFNLDAYYLTEKLKAACASLNQQNLYKIKTKQSFTELLIDYIEKTKFHEEVPLLRIYFNTFKMLLNNKKEDFVKLKRDLLQHEFEGEEINDAYLFGLNFCIQQMNAGNPEFNKEVFEMYQTGIQKEFLLKQGKLSSITFSNIVTIGLRLKRFEEVESFIQGHNHLLSGTEKKTYYAFNLAKVYFEKGAYEKVTTLYNEKLIKEILLNIQMRILQMKAFYELKEYDLCESLIFSTDQLLNRKGVLAYHKNVFKNFIKLFKQLLNLNSFDKSANKKLKASIQNTEKLVDRNWLLEKVSA